MGTPRLPQKAGGTGDGETESDREQSFAATADVEDLYLVSQEAREVVLDTGATAKLACFSWLARHNRILGRRGIPRVTTCPSKATFRPGDGCLGEARHAADIPVGVAGIRGRLTAFAPEADIPALLRSRAMEALGGQLDFLRGSLNLRRQGEQIPLRVNRVGHHILSAVDLRKDT